MSKKPTIRKFDVPTEDQAKQIDQVVSDLAAQAPLQTRKKHKGGRPKKYDEKPVKRTINIPVELDAALVEKAEEETAGNVTALILRAIGEYLKV